MNSSREEYLNWTSKRRISLPTESADEYMAIPIREYQRLQKRITDELKPKTTGLSSAYFALFGAAVAIGVAIPPLMGSSRLPSWIVPTFIVSASACLVLGLVLLTIDRILARGRRDAVTQIVDEMLEIEKAYRGRLPLMPP
jgi:hypothetical protein